MSLKMNPALNKGRGICSTDSGTYTWRVRDDIITADAFVAGLFGLPLSAAEQGLPLAHFLKRVHPEDLERSMSAISTAVDERRSFHISYRVVSETGDVTNVVSLGRCLQDNDKMPVEYAGLLIRVGAPEDGPATADALVDACAMAFKTAERTGQGLVRYLLSMALIELGRSAVADVTGPRH